MASLSSSQFHSPAEVLQTSQARKCHHAHRTKKKILVWKFGTWNVRSMVDVEGLIEIASQNHRGEEKKIDLIVRELSRYDVKVAALQETKLFGSGVYYVGGSVVLAAGRDVYQLLATALAGGRCSHCVSWPSNSSMAGSCEAVESVGQ